MKQTFLLIGMIAAPLCLPAQPFCYNHLFQDTAAPCITLFDPVCGCDGVTYDNDCVALRHFGIVGFVPGACDQITGPCNATAAVAARFHLDAKSHAFFRQTYELQDTTNLTIPDSLYQRALKALVSVYQLNNDPARDQMFAYMTRFDHQPYYSPYSISVGVDTAETWGKKVEAGEYPTGDTLVDQLVDAFHLHDRFLFTYLNKRWISFDSPFPLNSFALANAFRPVPGVLESSVGGFIDDGDQTLIQSWGNPMLIRFSYGWGDCPAGCIFRHYWTFSVDENCMATFVQSGGDPLPPLRTEAPAFIRQFEVNGGSVPHVNVRLTESMAFTLRAWNLLGQLQWERHFRTDFLDEALDWPAGPTGLYLVELHSEKGRAVRKVFR